MTMISSPTASNVITNTALEKDNVRCIDNPELESGSLSEHLYNTASLDTVQSLLDEQPQTHILTQWGLTLGEYRTQLRIAIDFISRE